MASPDHENTTGNTPDSPARTGPTAFSGVLIIFCILIAFGTFAAAVGAIRYMSLAFVFPLAFFGFGLFLTVRRHPRTPLYWLLVFGFLGLGSLGRLQSAHGALPSGDMSVAWVFWSFVWFLYWIKSKQVALIFGSPKTATPASS